MEVSEPIEPGAFPEVDDSQRKTQERIERELSAKLRELRNAEWDQNPRTVALLARLAAAERRAEVMREALEAHDNIMGRIQSARKMRSAGRPTGGGDPVMWYNFQEVENAVGDYISARTTIAALAGSCYNCIDQCAPDAGPWECGKVKPAPSGKPSPTVEDIEHEMHEAIAANGSGIHEGLSPIVAICARVARKMMEESIGGALRDLRSERTELAALKREIAADDERLKTAVTAAGIPWLGCDTAEHLADTIVELRAEVKWLTADLERLTRELVAERSKVAEYADHATLRAQLVAVERELAVIDSQVAHFRGSRDGLPQFWAGAEAAVRAIRATLSAPAPEGRRAGGAR